MDIGKLEFYGPGLSNSDGIVVDLIKKIPNDKKCIVIPCPTGNLVLPEMTDSRMTHMLKNGGCEIVIAPTRIHIYSMAQRIHTQTRDSFLIDPYMILEYSFSPMLKKLYNELEFDTLIVSQDVVSPLLLKEFTQVFIQECPNASRLVIADRLDTPYHVSDQSDRNDMDHTKLHIYKVSREDAYIQTKQCISKYGIYCGLNSGACYAVVQQSMNTSMTVILMDDSAYSYTDTLFNDNWLVSNNINNTTIINSVNDTEERYHGASVEDLQLPEAVSVFENDSCAYALDLMISRDFSQLPVINSKRKIVGLLSLEHLEYELNKNLSLSDPISKGMTHFKRSKEYFMITPYTLLKELEPFFDQHYAGFVTDSSARFPLAVVTKLDVLKFLSRRG